MSKNESNLSGGFLFLGLVILNVLFLYDKYVNDTKYGWLTGSMVFFGSCFIFIGWSIKDQLLEVYKQRRSIRNEKNSNSKQIAGVTGKKEIKKESSASSTVAKKTKNSSNKSTKGKKQVYPKRRVPNSVKGKKNVPGSRKRSE
jgi:cell division protein FtsB